MLPSRSFRGHEGQKWPKVFPPAKFGSSSVRAETFSVATSTQSGCVFFSFWKISFSQVRRSKILKTLSKSNVFLIIWILLGLPNLTETRFRGKKKNTHPDLRLVFVEKFSARPAQKFRRKRGKTFFPMLKTGFRDKRKLIQKLIFFLDSFQLF